ncbi:MAG: phosphoribosylanthranilate isomerase [Deltaproteobacteria bacterium]|nr:phosphoribosylanthranilate isomerase [Candidatus Tharpella aukensis]
MTTKIKICGLTRRQDVLSAGELGADLLGFVFAKSPRRISPERMVEISAGLPEGVLKVGVFVDAPLAEIQDVAAFCALDVLQLHGSEDLDYCRALESYKLLKVFRLGVGRTLPEDILPEGSVDFFWATLFDTWLSDMAGGGGKVFDWRQVLPWSGSRFFLAGGLNPENVGAAIEMTRPFGVDVSSGVESSPGIKDLAKMRKFIEAVKTAEKSGEDE